MGKTDNKKKKVRDNHDVKEGEYIYQEKQFNNTRYYAWSKWQSSPDAGKLPLPTFEWQPTPEANYWKNNPNKPIKEKTLYGSKQIEIEDKKLTPKKWMKGMIKKNQFSGKLLDEFKKFISKEKSGLSKKNKIEISSDEFWQYYDWFIISPEFKNFKKKDEAIKLIQRNFRGYLNKRNFRDYLNKIQKIYKLIRFKVTENLNKEGFKGSKYFIDKMIIDLKK